MGRKSYVLITAMRLGWCSRSRFHLWLANRLLQIVDFMKNSFLASILAILMCGAFSGCESTSQVTSPSGERVQLSGNKFESGDRVRRSIRFEGINGALHSGDNAKGSRVDFSRYQVFDEYGVVFEEGRKARTRYRIVDDHSWAKWGEGEEQFETSKTFPLRGYTVVGKSDGSAWTYSLNHRNADPILEAALNSIIYDQRALYPKSEMAIGTTWSHPALFVNAYLQREVRNVSGTSSLTLLRVERVNGERSAVIGLELDSQGDEVMEDGSVSSAKISLKGEIVLSLETYLETKVDLIGEMAGAVTQDGVIHMYTSPIRVESSETYVDEDGEYGL